MSKPLKIDGHDVYIEPLGTLESVRELPHIAGTVLPAMVKLAQDVAKDPGIDFDPDRVLDLIAQFGAFGDDFDQLAERLLATTAIRVGDSLVELTSRQVINEVFGGRLIFLFKVVFAAVGVHYRDFFSGGGASNAAPADK